MIAKTENAYGTIMIHSDVIASLASDATVRCYGVVGMTHRNIAEGLVSDSQSKGVKVVITENGISIDIHVIIKHGINLKVICNSIIENVRYQIENITGFKVQNVNVNVSSICSV